MIAWRLPREIGGMYRRWAQRKPESSTLARRGEMFSLFLIVSVVIFGSKLYFSLRYEPFQPGKYWRSHQSEFFHPLMYDGRPLVFTARAACFSIEDIAVGLWCLLTGVVLAGLVGPLGWRFAVRGLAYAAVTIAIVFQVMNIKLFKEMREFLRIDLFWLGGGFTPCPAVTQNIGPKSMVAVLILPITVLALHAAGQWAFPRFWRGAASILCRPAWVFTTALGLAVLGSWLRPLVGGEWSDFWRNSHFVFVQSLLERPVRFDDLDTSVAPDVSATPVGYTGQRLAQPPRNLIVIVLEAIGTSFLETYGGRLPTTPNLRRLASRSLTFDNYYATTNYSFGSSLALFAGVCGDPLTLSVFAENPWFPVPAAASHLQQLGYKTYFLGAGGEQWWEYLNTREHLLSAGYDVSRDPEARFWQGRERSLNFRDRAYGDEAMFEDARRAVHDAADRPFAMLLWTVDNHSPYRDGDGPSDWNVDDFPADVRGNPDRDSAFRVYLKAIWRIDRFIGRLIEDLERKGLAEDTLMVLTGDHGESFGDHGLLSHGNGLFESQVHVPLIFINSRLGVLGARNKVLGSHLDLWPTIFDLCSLPLRAEWSGRSLVSGGAGGRVAFFYSSRPGSCGLRDGRWKYLWDIRNEKHFLFDLESDPQELDNLADSRPFERELEHRRLKSWVTTQRKLARRRVPPASSVPPSKL